jgi:hypothetical protein
VLGHSSGRFLEERTRVGREALIQNPRAASCGALRLGGLVILFVARGGPRRGIGGGPVRHAGLNQRERLAGPSVPSFATPNSRLAFTPRFSQRAERRWRARRLRQNLKTTNRAAVLLIENDSVPVIGPTARPKYRTTMESHDNPNEIAGTSNESAGRVQGLGTLSSEVRDLFWNRRLRVQHRRRGSAAVHRVAAG